MKIPEGPRKNHALAIHWRTSLPYLFVRSLGRRLRLNNLLARWLFRGQQYEEKYDRILASSIRPGDQVWDIGANHGYYTTTFARLCGPSGTVTAFEPSRRSFQILEQVTATLPNVQRHLCGLGNQNAELRFVEAKDPRGKTSSFASGSGNPAGWSKARICRADGLIEAMGGTLPNVIKIDVEGFELEVLQGFGDCLSNPAIRSIGVEIHYGELQSRGFRNAPKEILGLLELNDFQVRWIDPSHIFAMRKGQFHFHNTASTS